MLIWPGFIGFYTQTVFKHMCSITCWLRCNTITFQSSFFLPSSWPGHPHSARHAVSDVAWDAAAAADDGSHTVQPAADDAAEWYGLAVPTAPTADESDGPPPDPVSFCPWATASASSACVDVSAILIPIVVHTGCPCAQQRVHQCQCTVIAADNIYRQPQFHV